MPYKYSDYTVVIAIMQCPKCTILVLKLTLGGGDTTPFVVPSAAIARALPLTFIGSTALRKGTRIF